MINASGKKAVACGNIGTKAFAEAVFELTPEDWAVLEVSSFQLETIQDFKPNVAAVLNVTPDHLDRHEDMQAYVEIKGRIFENQKAGDSAILNATDKYTPLLANLVKSQLYLFGFPANSMVSSKPGCYVVNDRIELLGRPLIQASEMKIPGAHNLENACAAALMASLCGVPDEAIAQTLRTFQGVEHRLEDSGEIDGVRFINDSKGTNVNSVAKALESFKRPIVLMLGGRDKNGDFRELAPLVKERVTRIVAFGECKRKIVGAAIRDRHGRGSGDAGRGRPRGLYGLREGRSGAFFARLRQLRHVRELRGPGQEVQGRGRETSENQGGVSRQKLI